MKKIGLFVLSIISLMVFISCAAAPYDRNAQFNQPLIYDLDSLRYDELLNTDIYNYIQDDYLDLIAVIPATNQFSEIEASWNQITEMIKKLSLIGNLLKIAPIVIIDKSSSEINALAASVSITLTVDDIVAFNDLKTFFSKVDGLESIKKEDLFAVHLERSLTNNEIRALSTLQHYYNLLQFENESINLKTMSYDELEPLLLSLMNPPSEEDLLEFESGLKLLQSIIK